MICATFISGPLSPPSAACSSAACCPRSSLQPEIALAGEPRRQPADRRADARIAPDAAAEPVAFGGVSHRSNRMLRRQIERRSTRMKHAFGAKEKLICVHLRSSAGSVSFAYVRSSSSMKPAITPRPLAQKAGIGGIEAEGGQQLLVPLGAAGAQHVEILLGEALLRALVDGIERVHQAVAEGIGIDVERRVDEVRDVGPVTPGSRRRSAAPAPGSRAASPARSRRCGRRSARPRAARRAAASRTRGTRSGAPPCSACPRPCRRA